MSARIAASVLVSALIRRIEGEGGHGMVLAKGDATAGAILIVALDRGDFQAVLERVLDASGAYHWRPAASSDVAQPAALANYLARRRARDADLWVVELDGRNVAGSIMDLVGA